MLERYLFRTAAVAFLAVLAAMTGVVWVTQALREIDLVTAKGQTIGLFLFVTALGLPSLFAIVAPVALFVAVLYALDRLNGDSELVAMTAAGATPARLLRPFLLLALLVALASAWLGLSAVPATLRVLREVVTRVRADLVSNIMNEGAFTAVARGLTLHVRERGPGAALLGVFVHDERNREQLLTYVAERGQIVEDGARTILVLEHGSVQRRDAGGRDAAIVAFERYAFDLSELAGAAEATAFKPRERYTAELLAPDPDDSGFKAQPGRFRAELHERFAAPLYPIAFVVVAFVAMGRPRSTREARSAAALFATAAAVAIRLAGLGATNLAARAPAAVALVYAIPLATILIGALLAAGPPLRARGGGGRPALRPRAA